MNGCQACLRLIESDKPVFYLNDIYLNATNPSTDAISIKDKLADCVPELLLDSVGNAAVCHSCVVSLMAAYDFRQQCLEAQQKIYGYLQQMPINTEINITQIAIYYKRLDVIARGGNPLEDNVAVDLNRLEDNVGVDATKNQNVETLQPVRKVEPNLYEGITNNLLCLPVEIKVETNEHETRDETLLSSTPNNLTEKNLNADVTNSQFYFPAQIKVEPNEEYEINGESSNFSLNNFVEALPAISTDTIPYENVGDVQANFLTSVLPANIEPHANYSAKNKKLHKQDKTNKVSPKKKLKQKHQNKAAKLASKLKKKHTCQLCEETFPDSNQLVYHRYLHSKEIGKCDSCSFTCRSLYILKRHQRVHNEEQFAVQCKLCHDRFKTTSALDAHTNTKHTSPYEKQPKEKSSKKKQQSKKNRTVQQ